MKMPNNFKNHMHVPLSLNLLFCNFIGFYMAATEFVARNVFSAVDC